MGGVESPATILSDMETGYPTGFAKQSLFTILPAKLFPSGLRRETMDMLDITRKTLGQGDQALLVLRVSGYIDASNVDQFEGAVHRAIDEQGHRRLVVSLQETQYINSSGLGVLISASQKLSGQGYFALAAVPAKIVRIIRLLGFADVVAMYATEDDAFQGVHPLKADEPESP
jgi:stage II sporulation protein AA (anti-sigma F factor antagonist)